MSSMMFDPVTGLPKQQGTNTGFGAPLFATTPGGPSSGATGYGLNATTGGATTGGVDYGAYRDIIQSDPFYKQTLADLSAANFADEASAKAAAQSGFIRFGEVPTDAAGQFASWIDPTTRDLATQNTTAGLSTVARLAKANKDAIRQIRNALAARGALRSGEFGHQLGEENTRFSQANYDARLQLTDYLGGIQRGLAQAQQQRAAQQAAAAAAAAARGAGGGQGPGAGGGGGGGGGGAGGGYAPPAPQYPGDQYAVPAPLDPRGYDAPPNPWAAAGSTSGADPFLSIDPNTGLVRRR